MLSLPRRVILYAREPDFLGRAFCRFVVYLSCHFCLCVFEFFVSSRYDSWRRDRWLVNLSAAIAVFICRKLSSAQSLPHVVRTSIPRTRPRTFDIMVIGYRYGIALRYTYFAIIIAHVPPNRLRYNIRLLLP